jgi:hypothetical protein
MLRVSGIDLSYDESNNTEVDNRLGQRNKKSGVKNKNRHNNNTTEENQDNFDYEDE